jgi:hypothetical protein
MKVSSLKSFDYVEKIRFEKRVIVGIIVGCFTEDLH